MCSSLLLLALYWTHQRRFGPFLATVVVAMLAKEEISALVCMLGLYGFFVLRERRLGAGVFVLGLTWFAVCTRVIMPHYSGLASSPFLARLAIFGPTLKESLLNALRQPVLVLRWLGRREVVTYLAGLAAPVLALNVFSNWSWTYSEGAHYSATIVPFVIVSAIYGTGVVARQLTDRGLPYHQAIAALSAMVLGISAVHHHQISVSPLARTFHPPSIDAHDHLGHQLIDSIPAQAAVSAQSNLYPHLAHREKAYFFPAVNDAEYVLLDVTSPAYPLTVRGLHLEAVDLLRSAQFGIWDARDGYLLFKRGAPPSASAEMPAAFYTFARAGESEIGHPMRVAFGDDLELVGYDVMVLNVVQAQELPVQIKTFWRALRPLRQDVQFVWFFTRDDGAIVYHYHQGTPTTVWLPPSRWPEGEVMVMQTPILNVGRLHEVLLAVTPPGRDIWAQEDRLAIQPTSAPHAELRAEGTLLKLLQFR
jgi:hypothetical protein